MTDEELFEVFDENNAVTLGRVPRSQVHRRGLYHRSVHVLVFNRAGELLLQRRADTKDVSPGLWDVSVGEHLQPGETYEAGARRGLQEELGITGVTLLALRPPRLQVVEIPERGLCDREFVSLWRTTFDGPVHGDPEEVAAVRWCSLTAAKQALQTQPNTYTTWLQEELRWLLHAQGSCAS